MALNRLLISPDPPAAVQNFALCVRCMPCVWFAPPLCTSHRATIVRNREEEQWNICDKSKTFTIYVTDEDVPVGGNIK